MDQIIGGLALCIEFVDNKKRETSKSCSFNNLSSSEAFTSCDKLCCPEGRLVLNAKKAIWKCLLLLEHLEPKDLCSCCTKSPYFGEQTDLRIRFSKQLSINFMMSNKLGSPGLSIVKC